MELYHLKIYIDDLLHRAVGPISPFSPLGPVGPIIQVGLHFWSCSIFFNILS